MRLLALILTFAVGFLGSQLYIQKTLKAVKVVQLEAEVDSLNTELFNSKTINGRYELSLEHLKEVNPKAAKQFQDYLDNETE